MALSELLSKVFVIARNSKQNILSRVPAGSYNFVQNADIKQKVEGKHDLPPKPKKPLTPYFRFMAQIRPDIVREHPQSKMTDIVKIAAEKWVNASQDIKQKLAEEYKQDIMSYEREREKYEKLLTDEQRELIKRIREDAAVSKEKRSLKKKMRELGKPKKPGSAFLAFFTSKLPSRGNVPFKDWQKEVSKEWANLSDEVKASYQRESAIAMDAHRKQLQEWEERMVRMGHIDVVRSEALIEPRHSRKGSKASPKFKQ